MSTIDSEERLARFVFHRSSVRPDRTVKSDLFMPPSDRELSVTRHLGLGDKEIWKAGQTISVERALPLYGRADIQAKVPRELSLDVVPQEPPPNHAVIVGWPEEKSAQKVLAQQIAALATFVPPPT